MLISIKIGTIGRINDNTFFYSDWKYELGTPASEPIGTFFGIEGTGNMPQWNERLSKSFNDFLVNVWTKIQNEDSNESIV